MPGLAHPEEINFQETVKSGKWAIDCWDGDPREKHSHGKIYRDFFHQVYYFRPKTKENEEYLTDFSWGGECIFLSDKGCVLPAEKRPYECRELEPKPDFQCKSHNNKQNIIFLWLPYQKEIRQILKEYNDL